MSNTPQQKFDKRLSRTDRAKQQIRNGGIAREDSDDELGLEDHPWEWVYSDPNDAKSEIVAARMGQFECRVGDCVLLKAEGNNEAWIGLICEFQEEVDEDGDVEMAANFMWFSTEREIRNKTKKRTDFLPNEVYLTPSWDVNPLASINGKAIIMSSKAFQSKYPSGKVPRTSKEFGKAFVCRRGCNTRTATYTSEFIWEEVYKGASDILSLVELVQGQTKATRKRRRDSGYCEDISEDVCPNQKFQDSCPHADFSKYNPKQDPEEPETPRKKRKVSEIKTPSSKHKGAFLKTPTSSHKRIILKKPLTFTPLSTRILSPAHTTSSPFQLARSNLHVSSVPVSLPCRQDEFATVYSHLESAITEGTGACIYISGTPGTGKTATVREVVSQLNASVQAEELDDFLFVEINGMKVTDPHQSYSLLWEALKGERVSPGQALGLLEREFDHPSPRRVPCVVLMDELDQLVTKNQAVMYNFFNWPGLRHSRLIVLAVANTMDLPERTLSNKISSRLGLTRILFPGYTHEQLQEIIRSRLEGVPENIVDSDAVQFASRKVAAVSGDARRALDICRRAVEIAESQSKDVHDDILDTPSKSARRKERMALEKGEPLKRDNRVKVTIQTIKRAINEATCSPIQQHLKALPLSAKLFLAALMARTRRSGVNESDLSDVIEEAKKLAVMAVDSPNIASSLLMQESNLRNWNEDLFAGPKKVARLSKAVRVSGLAVAATELAECGVIGLEGARKGERIGKVRLDVADTEINAALKEDPDVRGLGFS